MRRIGCVVVLALSVMLTPLIVEAQQERVYRIAYLGNASALAEANRVESLREGLRDFGYVEGKNIVIEFKWAEGRNERLPELAAELAGCGRTQ